MKAIFIILLLLLVGQQSTGQPVRKKQPSHDHLTKSLPRAQQRIYYDVGEFRYGLAEVKYKGKYGLIDTNGKIVLPCKYDHLGSIHDDKIEVSLKGKWGVVYVTGKVLIPLHYSSIFCSEHTRGSNFGSPEMYYRVDSNGKTGKILRSGQVAYPCIYDELRNGRGGFDLVKIGDSYGVINRSGKIAVPVIYDDVDIERAFSSSLFRVRTHGRNYTYGFVDTNGIEVIPCKYRRVDYTGNRYMTVAEHPDKWGVLNAKGKEIIPCLYSSKASFYEGLFITADSCGRFGILDTNNQVVVPFVFDSLSVYSEGRVAVKAGGKWGYLNRGGKQVIPYIYTNAGRFRDGVAKVVEDVGSNGQRGDAKIIDTMGNEVQPKAAVTPPAYVEKVDDDLEEDTTHIYRYAGLFNDRRALVRTVNRRYGFINPKGERVIPCRYRYAEEFQHGFAMVTTKAKTFLIDTAGQIAFEHLYDQAVSGFETGIAIVRKENKCGAIDTTGKVIIQFKYDELEPFFDGRAVVKIDSHWGYINLHEEMVIKSSHRLFSFQDGVAFDKRRNTTCCIDTNGIVLFCGSYDTFQMFRNGLSLVEKGNKIGFINKRGKLVIPFRFTYAVQFENEIAVAGLETSEDKEKYGIIDKWGRWLIPPLYAAMSVFSPDGLAIVRVNGRLGFINRRNRLVIPARYDQAEVSTTIRNSWIAVEKSGHWGYIDKTGKQMLWLK